VAYVPFPAHKATAIAAIVQASDGKESAWLMLKCTILVSPMTASNTWANTKYMYEYASQTGSVAYPAFLL